MDLSTYTLPELRRLQSKVESEIRRRSDVTRRNLIKRMQKMAADEGLSLDDLLEAAPRQAPKQSPQPSAAAVRARRPPRLPNPHRSSNTATRPILTKAGAVVAASRNGRSTGLHRANRSTNSPPDTTSTPGK
jgi:H-NS histone family.